MGEFYVVVYFIYILKDNHASLIFQSFCAFNFLTYIKDYRKSTDTAAKDAIFVLDV